MKRYNLEYIKTKDEYLKEIKLLFAELALAIETDTPIKDEDDKYRRIQEVAIIINFLSADEGE